MASDSEGASITKEHFDHLMNLLQQSKLSSGPQEITVGFANFAGLIGNLAFRFLACYFSKVENSPWIIDSGATNHMTTYSSFLSDIKLLIFSYLVTLPNGYKVKVTCTGTLNLTPEISLTNVLLVLSFQYNLISLVQLILQISCLDLFSSVACVLQSLSLKRPVTLGGLQNGHYILNPTTLTSACNSVFNTSFVNTLTANSQECRIPVNPVNFKNQSTSVT